MYDSEGEAEGEGERKYVCIMNVQVSEEGMPGLRWQEWRRTSPGKINTQRGTVSHIYGYVVAQSDG
jgi:hypothetical protein